MAKPLHRIREVRHLQGVSLRTVARMTKTSIGTLKSQEKETSDLPLSALHRWCNVLGVPVSELLVEPSDGLSESVLVRSRLIQLMKTASAIVAGAKTDATRCLANAMVNQLTTMMPELVNVKPEPNTVSTQPADRLGRIAYTTVPDGLFAELG